jgi:hypothetical protein
MDDTRRKVLLAHRELLHKKPFDKHGCRYEIIGSMFSIFGEEEDKIEEGMIQLGDDMAELNMTLSSYPHRPDLLCAMEQLETWY